MIIISIMDLHTVLIFFYRYSQEPSYFPNFILLNAFRMYILSLDISYQDSSGFRLEAILGYWGLVACDVTDFTVRLHLFFDRPFADGS